MGLKDKLTRLLNLPSDIFSQVSSLLESRIRWSLYYCLKPLVSEATLNHLNKIRQHEIALVRALLPAEGQLLEIGAGTGIQSRQLSNFGYTVTAIEVIPPANEQMPSIYRENRVYPIVEYDGHHLPFSDGTFDIVFSSSVLEHIPHAKAFQEEILRVLKNDGYAIHIMPNTIWRFYSNITHYIRQFAASPIDKVSVLPRHGEQGNLFTEHYYFNQVAWRYFFAKMGWKLIKVTTNQLFYTGYSIFDHQLSLTHRSKLSRILGACCNVYLLKKTISKEFLRQEP